MLSDLNYFQERIFISLIYSNHRIVLNTRLHLHTNIVIYILSVHSESILNDLSPYKPSFFVFCFFLLLAQLLFMNTGSCHSVCSLSWTNT